jgi:hypothetical protein
MRTAMLALCRLAVFLFAEELPHTGGERLSAAPPRNIFLPTYH